MFLGCEIIGDFLVDRGTAYRIGRKIIMHPDDLHDFKRQQWPWRYYNVKVGRGGRRKRQARQRARRWG